VELKIGAQKRHLKNNFVNKIIKTAIRIALCYGARDEYSPILTEVKKYIG
jgi:hypothetical protein